MKVLLIYKVFEEIDKYFLNAIKDVLLKYNHNVLTISEMGMKAVDYKQFSVVLIYNTILTKKILNNIQNELIPKVLILEESKIFHSYITKSNWYDKVVLVKDHEVRTTNYLPRALTDHILYPYCLNNKVIHPPKKNERLKVVVAFKSNYANELLIRIAPVINHFQYLDFEIISEQKYLPNIFNENSTRIPWKSLDKEIEDSDFIISSGPYALRSILEGKPVIVVGDNGYGGLITSQTIEKQFHSFFSGRIGGEIKEYIPSKLLVEDIITICEMEKRRNNNFSSRTNLSWRNNMIFYPKLLINYCLKSSVIIRKFKTTC
jgi:hypothetical protein